MGRDTMFKNSILATLFLLTSVSAQAETIENKESNTTQSNQKEQIAIKTVRGVLGQNNPIEHAKGQIRAGYITFKADGSTSHNAYGVAGHYHFDSKRWNGLEIGVSAYTVLNLGGNQNANSLNGDFFDAQGKSFIQFTEAYLDGKWGKTEVKLGRQILDTPHADSDDIRMIPNYFEAYTVSNNDIEDLTLMVGFIHRMAGWENGVDASKFVKISETLGSPEKTDGVVYASASYEGFKELSLNLWYYNYIDIAEVLYAEAAYHLHISKNTVITMGLQYDGTKENGMARLGEQDANTFGISMEVANEKRGIHILLAYNRDNSTLGATGLSLGGGPFFTSMEDQTLDAIGSGGEAWMIAAGYHFEAIGIDGLHAGIAYGNFQSNQNNTYESKELDVLMDYTFNKDFSLTTAFASVDFEYGMDDNNNPLTKYNQLRIILNYNL